MELNDVRILVTLGSFLMFAVIAVWACWPANHDDFNDAARLPFLDEESAK
ncbi:cbb3-type cytochrome oxidase subunit 3 [Aquabacterium sp.]